MVYDRSRNELNAFDWKMLGVDPKEPRIKRIRLDVPLPYDREGFYILADIFEHLSIDMKSIGDRLSDRQRTKMTSAQWRIRDYAVVFVNLWKKWQAELTVPDRDRKEGETKK